MINNSRENTTTVELPTEAVAYVLAGKDGMRSRAMMLNGHELALDKNDELPELSGEAVFGNVELAPGSCAFIVI